MPDAEYAILRTFAELECFIPAWARLWAEDPDATPFQRPEWLLPWWRQFGSSNLSAVTIREGPALLGFLPFYRYREPCSKQETLLLLGVGTTDYLDGLFAPACTESHIEGALRLLLAASQGSRLCATQLRPASKLAATLASVPGASRFDSERCSRMPAVPIGDLPKKIRRNAMYYGNRARKLAALDYRLADASNCADAFADLVSFHTERWKARGESGVLADPRVLAWHREALPLLARNGHLRLGSLCLGGEPIGVLYSLVDPPGRPARTQYFYLTAFSGAHSDLRPGTLLLAAAVDAAAAEGVHHIDMLRGEESYKQIWHLEPHSTVGFSVPRAEPDSAVPPLGEASA